MKTWQPSDLKDAAPVSDTRLSVLEFQDNSGEWHSFDILKTNDRLIFGGTCNVGFLESGYIVREDCESIDETLSELLSDLETYYNDGRQYVSRIVCNERM